MKQLLLLAILIIYCFPASSQYQEKIDQLSDSISQLSNQKSQLDIEILKLELNPVYKDLNVGDSSESFLLQSFSELYRANKAKKSNVRPLIYRKYFVLDFKNETTFIGEFVERKGDKGLFISNGEKVKLKSHEYESYSYDKILESIAEESREYSEEYLSEVENKKKEFKSIDSKIEIIQSKLDSIESEREKYLDKVLTQYRFKKGDLMFSKELDGEKLILGTPYYRNGKIYYNRIEINDLAKNYYTKEEFKKAFINKYGARSYKHIVDRVFGMRDPKVVLLYVLGEPDDINRTVGSFGVHEQWVYRKRDMYIYIEDGYVTSWQD
jgi:prefoldin subunit 5